MATKKLSIFTPLFFILLILTACSMPYIEDIPEWMAGDWDILSETGEYIGRCEIDSYSIEVTIDSYGYERFDLLQQAMQNGGWSETSNTAYTLYTDIGNSNYYEFIKHRVSDIEIRQYNSYALTASFTLSK